MDKNAIKKYATWARRELIARVSQKAEQYGITEKKPGDVRAESVNGYLLSQVEQVQRRALILRVQQSGYRQVMEEVAYTWFNRFCALRFMEANHYLPTHIRVFTDEEGAFKPQIIAEAIHLEMDGLNMDKVYQFKHENKTEELYKYLLITQCNALNVILPQMFQRIADYTELLLPDNLLREGSVIEQMIALIPESDWMDQVQIIGWLYQYYNAEPKDQVFANLKKNIKISKADIPAATQLFTPDWIVRYMVENSLGRLWVEGHPNETLKAGWKYYLEEAEQEPDVQAQLDKIREEYKAMKPEDIRCIDPCMGSGHILVYMFDVLVQIYEAYGYSTREAVQSIVENNLYGLDIDDRAAQLAYFAVMMKARQYDKRFFSRGAQPHVCAIQESGHMPEEGWGYFDEQEGIARRVYDAFVDAKEYGSILEPNVMLEELDALERKMLQKLEEADLAATATAITACNVMWPLVRQARMLVQKYDVVVTNPPYMGSTGMSERLSSFVNYNYSLGKSDMFAAFVERCSRSTRENGFYAMITQPSLLFLASFEKLRRMVLKEHSIDSLLHLGRGIFGIDFGSTSFVIRNLKLKTFVGNYFRLHQRTFQYIDPDDIKTLYLNAKADHSFTYDFTTYNTKTFSEDAIPDINEDDIESETTKLMKLHYYANQNNFLLFPGAPIAYWASSVVFAAFDHGRTIRDVAYPCEGIKTGDNERFLRYWFEIDVTSSSIHTSIREAKWCKMAKGGPYRRWYGNLEYVVIWQNNGSELKEFIKSTVSNENLFFTPAITWSYISAGKISMRDIGTDILYNNKGPACYCKMEDKDYLLGLANSVVFNYILGFWAPTMDYKPGNISPFPYIEDAHSKDSVTLLSQDSVHLSRDDWDSFEASWDFESHPIVRKALSCFHWNVEHTTVEECFKAWAQDCEIRFQQLKSNEEELNRIFIDIYGLRDELTPEVDDKDVTVRPADRKRDIRSLISYAVGCMLGRYSLTESGLAYAGGEWDERKYYGDFMPDRDNILPICDDEYFADDIVSRFVRFVKVVFGKETLEENLRFIADALGGSGSPRDVIRSYFVNDFFADHLKIYQKRPIYWLFNSGKKNGFKALIYMHRYAPDTIARIRTDYVHEQQSRYRTALADLTNRMASASTSERVKLSKQFANITAQAEELRVYEEKIHHLADQMISIDLDDGVKRNYEIFQDVLAQIK